MKTIQTREVNGGTARLEACTLGFETRHQVVVTDDSEVLSDFGITGLDTEAEAREAFDSVSPDDSVESLLARVASATNNAPEIQGCK